MKIISIDPGAERWGWALLDVDGGEVSYCKSGVNGLKRGKSGRKFTEPYQQYKKKLIYTVAHATQSLIFGYKPDKVVYETLPVVNSGEWSGGAQRVLGQVMCAASMGVCAVENVPYDQVAVNTIKKNIGGHAKATKVKVRNGVFNIFPELEYRKKDWVKVFEEPDAIATGLAHLGVKSVLE